VAFVNLPKHVLATWRDKVVAKAIALDEAQFSQLLRVADIDKCGTSRF
jgi:hypothetical protein